MNSLIVVICLEKANWDFSHKYSLTYKNIK